MTDSEGVTASIKNVVLPDKLGLVAGVPNWSVSD